MVKTISWLLVFLASIFFAFAQETNRYVVFFTDKDNNGYAIDAPEEFLSAKSIQRRTNQGIAIVEEDLPLTENYIDAVDAIDLVDVYYPSKWFNAILIQADEASIPDIEALSFVNEVKLVAPQSRLTITNDNFDTSGSPSIPVSNPNEKSTSYQNGLMQVPQMQSDGFFGEDMLIAVMDAGFPSVNRLSAYDDIFNENRILLTYDYVFNEKDVYRLDSHGSNVFSFIAGTYSTDFIGTAPGADYMLFITEDVESEYRIEEYNFLFAAERADSAGVDVITTSLGYSTFDNPSMNYTQVDLDGKTAVMTQAAEKSFSKGIVVISSAGNEGGTGNAWQKVTPAADGINVMAIGAVDIAGTRAPFSSIGPSADGRIKPDVSAFGEQAVYVSTSGVISSGNGTSYSAPQVAGFIAALWQALPALSAKELIDVVRTTATLGDNPNNQIGYGIPSYLNATDLPLAVDKFDDVDFKVYPTLVDGQQAVRIFIKNRKLEGMARLINSEGKEQMRFALTQGENLLQMRTLPVGLYLLKLQNNKTVKLLKTN